MLCVMHLGSVLVGIVVGLVLGLLIGRLVRRPLRSHTFDDSPAPPAGQPAAQADTVSLKPDELGPQTRPAEPAWAGSTSEFFPVPGDPEPALEPALHEDHSLIEALREANERLTKEAQTRLSRASGDSSAEPDGEPALVSPPGSGGAQTSGQDLLERSRRLAEDAKIRLSRDAAQENP
jgi:hypothetical protein